MKKSKVRKNHVRAVIVHEAENLQDHLLAQKINEFHASVIERRLKQSNLSAEEKLIVLNKLVENTKSGKRDEKQR